MFENLISFGKPDFSAVIRIQIEFNLVTVLTLDSILILLFFLILNLLILFKSL